MTNVEEHLVVFVADPPLGAVEAISRVTVCFSVNLSTVEAECMAGEVEVEFVVEVWEAHFCSTESVAGDWGALSDSFVSIAADWLELCCKWVIAGVVMAVC